MKKILKSIVCTVLCSSLPILCMNNNKSEVQKLFQPVLLDIVTNIDTSFKKLLNFCEFHIEKDTTYLTNNDTEHKNTLINTIKDKLEKLATLTEKKFFDWHPDLIKKMCKKINKTLNTNCTLREYKKHLESAFAMKNYLFDQFDQTKEKKFDHYTFEGHKNVLRYITGFYTEKEDTFNDKRSLDELKKEYQEYKDRFKGIIAADEFFKELDQELLELHNNQQLLQQSKKNINDIISPRTFSGKFQWFINNYLCPGKFTEEENDEIINQERDKETKYLDDKLNDIEVQMKKLIALNMMQFRKEAKYFTPFSDNNLINDHKDFLNLLLELEGKKRKQASIIDMSECGHKHGKKCSLASCTYHATKNIMDTHVKKNMYRLIGYSTDKVEYGVENLKKYLGKQSESLKNFSSSKNHGLDGFLTFLSHVNSISDIESAVGPSITSSLIFCLEKIITNETIWNKLSKMEKRHLKTDHLGVFKDCRDFFNKNIYEYSLTPNTIKNFTHLLSEEKLGVILKTVLRIATNNPPKFRKIIGESISLLIDEIVKKIVTQETLKKFKESSYKKSRTTYDDIELLNYLAEENRKISQKPLSDKEKYRIPKEKEGVDDIFNNDDMIIFEKKNNNGTKQNSIIKNKNDEDIIVPPNDDTKEDEEDEIDYLKNKIEEQKKHALDALPDWMSKRSLLLFSVATASCIIYHFSLTKPLLKLGTLIGCCGLSYNYGQQGGNIENYINTNIMSQEKRKNIADKLPEWANKKNIADASLIAGMYMLYRYPRLRQLSILTGCSYAAYRCGKKS